MAINKYYLLETDSIGDLQSLQRKLKEYLHAEFAEKDFGVIPLEDGERAEALPMQPTRDFALLFQEQEELEKAVAQEKRLFWVKTPASPARTEVRLVIQGSEYVMRDFQQYLKDSSFEIQEAKKVSYAVINFATQPDHNRYNVNFKEALENFIHRNYSDVSIELQITKSVQWRENEGDICSGMLEGPLEEVLTLGEMLESGGYGMDFERYSIIFFSKRHGHEGGGRKSP